MFEHLAVVPVARVDVPWASTKHGTPLLRNSRYVTIAASTRRLRRSSRACSNPRCRFFRFETPGTRMVSAKATARVLEEWKRFLGARARLPPSPPRRPRPTTAWQRAPSPWHRPAVRFASSIAAATANMRAWVFPAETPVSEPREPVAAEKPAGISTRPEPCTRSSPRHRAPPCPSAARSGSRARRPRGAGARSLRRTGSA